MCSTWPWTGFFALKGMIGTNGEIWIGSENSVVITYQCQYSDFGGCIWLHRKMPFVCRKHTKEFGGNGALGWPLTEMVQETNILPLYLRFSCKLVNVSKILKIKAINPYFPQNCILCIMNGVWAVLWCTLAWMSSEVPPSQSLTVFPLPRLCPLSLFNGAEWGECEVGKREKNHSQNAGRLLTTPAVLL